MEYNLTIDLEDIFSSLTDNEQILLVKTYISSMSNGQLKEVFNNLTTNDIKIIIENNVDVAREVLNNI
jgi:hypothetical protein